LRRGGPKHHCEDGCAFDHYFNLANRQALALLR
jgi:hypothetical protein